MLRFLPGFYFVFVSFGCVVVCFESLGSSLVCVCFVFEFFVCFVFDWFLF